MLRNADLLRLLIWLHLDPLIVPVWFYKDPTQILEKFPQVSIMLDNWSIHDLELILLTGLNNV